MKNKKISKLESLKKFKLSRESKNNIFAGQGGPVREFIDVGGTATSGDVQGTTCASDFMTNDGMYYGWGGCTGTVPVKH